MTLTLVILAAGMGSRYGGLKQLDEVGPGGETVMDYSVFDALRAGFGRVVFVIRKEIEEAFRASVGSRYEGRIAVEYAFQELDDLPESFQVPEGRVKPWGTGQAVYAARHLLKGPFAVINADDFYGADSFRKIAAMLREPQSDSGGVIQGCIAAFRLGNTLSENGSVSRGLCAVDGQGYLAEVVENTRIYRQDGRILSEREDGTVAELAAEELVSMNCWGFPAGLLGELERLFTQFLAAHGRESKSEFYLPFAIDTLIREGKARVRVLPSEDSWFGITYKEDKPFVQQALRELTASGAYPGKLFA